VRSTADFRSIVEGFFAPVILADRRGHVNYRNRAAQACLGDSDRIETLLQSVAPSTPLESWTTVLHQALGTIGGIQLPCTWTHSAAAAKVWGTMHIAQLPKAPTRRRHSASPPTEIAVITFVEGDVAGVVDEPQEMSRRLASLGKLAARVAHELNNPLDGILRYINLALRIVGEAPEPKLKTYLAESRTGLMRMVQIIGDLLEYSRSTAGEFDDIGINEVIEESVRSQSAAADERRIVIAVDFQHRDMPKVRGSRLYQVVCNLLRNAVDAMPQGGRLTITSGVVEGFVVIRVADTGVGLPEPIERVFEPFFTTKPPGQGTGLGLAISKDFIEDMQGTITAAQGESGGAVFTVRLPVDGLETSKRRNAETQTHGVRIIEGGLS